jgi:hypothetical protein
MLKFLHVSRISNFYIFLADFSSNFKHVVLSHMDELLGLLYMVGKLEMSSFQPNLSGRKMSHVAPNMSQIVHNYDVANLTRFI